MCYRANGLEEHAILCLGDVIINALELFNTILCENRENECFCCDWVEHFSHVFFS